MHANELEFKKQQIIASGGLEPVLTGYGRLLLFANGARMERVPVTGDWACIPSGFMSRSEESGQFDYWEARHDNVKGRFDELFTKIDQHLQGSMSNPGFPPPDDSEWNQLRKLRKEVLICKREMEKYRAVRGGIPTPSPDQMQMSLKAEALKRDLHRLRV